MISVIVPVYNVEDYLNRCIDSILAQTFENFELVLIDDGSTDRTGAICDSYQEQDKRVVVIHQENQGVSAARNTGVKVARGEYITFIDGDDWISKVSLERMYAACERHQAQLITCYLGTAPENGQQDILPSDNETVMSGRQAVQKYGLLMDTRFRGPVNKLIKKEILLKHPFPVGRAYSEDTACVYLWMWDADVVVELDEKLYFNIKRENSISNIEYGEHRLSLFDTYNEMLAFYRENGLEELFTHTLAVFFCDLIRDYGQCLLLNKNIIMPRMQIVLRRAVQKWLDNDFKKTIATYEDLIPVLKKSGADKVCEEYVCVCAQRMAYDISSGYCPSQNTKKRLRKFLFKYRPKIKRAPVAYNVVFGRFSNWYWACKHKLGFLSKGGSNG